MNYIINPSVFYWMSVFGDLGFIFDVAGFALMFFLCAYILTKFLEGTLGDCKRFVIKLFLLTVPVVLISVFIPSEETMIKILIARTATVENIGLTADTLQSAVDYIVQAIQSVK